MNAILYQKDSAATLLPRAMVITILLSLVAACLAQNISAQCADHPETKTALKFNNESSYELTFFIDDDEKGITVPSRTFSIESEVEPGEHLLRARAVVKGESFWVWVVNEVLPGQICTWTIEDPPKEVARFDNKYRTVIDPRLKGKKRTAWDRTRGLISLGK